MEIITNVVTKNIDLDYDLQITGILVGNITISTNGNLVLNGIVNGYITLNAGSCKIHGMVNGNVNNNGGILEIYGTINGTVNTQSGKTKIDPNAVIRNR